MAELYPVTIVQARYGGTYESGKWLAFNRHPSNLPEDWDGSDIECMNFWIDNKEPIGRGLTPELALLDLYNRITR